ncbi:hypothetical protein Tco_0748226 [Tanacetum coccineum]|uniref:Uncharacterized protein n=1 Tax=Tanacetum coccineum TaxID=301880 RepID=A0ABQ4YXL9_9ASTR
MVVEGTVRDQNVGLEPVGLEPVSPRLFCSGLKVYHLPPASLIEILHDVVGTSGYHYGVLRPSRWKELSKETSSKILPCGDGSCWKTFKANSYLDLKGKLNKHRRVLFLFSPQGLESPQVLEILKVYWFESSPKVHGMKNPFLH